MSTQELLFSSKEGYFAPSIKTVSFTPRQVIAISTEYVGEDEPVY